MIMFCKASFIKIRKQYRKIRVNMTKYTNILLEAKAVW